MDFALWSVIVGALLVFMALAGSVLQRLPVSTSMVYLAVGVGVSPVWLDLVAPEPVADAGLLEHLTEIAVLVSLFTSGMKLAPSLDDARWWLPIRLAFGSMIVTVALISMAGVLLLGLPLGAAVLLGAILAPTDPVLASDVQLEEPGDRDRLRFALTGEGGMNDGTAFPFVMLGLGLLGLHELGALGWRWLAVDVLWAGAAGFGIGAACGTVIGRLVLYLRRTHKEAVGLDDFLALGLIALSYGVALLLHAYGFLAVFAAGVALRRIERVQSEAGLAQRSPDVGLPAGASPAGASPAGASPAGASQDRASPGAATAAAAGDGLSTTPSRPAALPQSLPHPSRLAVQDSGVMSSVPDRAPADLDSTVAALAGVEPHAVATDPRHAPAYLARAVLGFNEQIERIGEVAAVIAIGALLWAIRVPPPVIWFVPLLFLVIRPLSVAIGLAGSRTSRTQRRLIGWFGIRGIGSLYYLAYAIGQGLDEELAQTLSGITLTVVVCSVIAHGLSVTPLMALYARRGVR